MIEKSGETAEPILGLNSLKERERERESFINADNNA